MRQLDIRSYGADAIPALLALTQTTLGNSGAVRKTEAFWRWKHHANPFGSSFGLYTWHEEAQLATGLRVLLRWQFCNGQGQRLRAVRAVDTATHPNYQRNGIFSTLTRRAIADLTAEGVDFIYNTPNQQSLPGYVKMGWQVIAQWPLYLRPRRPWRMLVKRLFRQRRSATFAFSDHFTPRVIPWSQFIKHYSDQLPTMIEQAELARTQVGLRTLRTLDYLDWRYGQHPHIQYGVYAEMDKANSLTSFAILRPNVRYGWQETVLAELFFVKPTLIHGIGFMNRLAKALRSDYLIAHVSQATVERRILQYSGFLRIPRQGMLFTVRPLQDEQVTDLTAPTSWDLTLGDLEIF